MIAGTGVFVAAGTEVNVEVLDGGRVGLGGIEVGLTVDVDVGPEVE